MPKYFRIIACVIVPTLVAGATDSCRKTVPATEPEYSLGFYNATPAQITDARADWSINGISRHDAGGVMNPGVEALLHGEPRPIPQNATVSWVTADGAKHERAVEVAKLIADPARFSGIVYFKIYADSHVQVVPLTYDERDRLAMSQKPYP